MRSRLCRLRGAGVSLALALAASAPARADEWAVSAGVFNVGKSPTVSAAGLEVHRATRWPGVDAVAGLAGTDEGAVWAWAGARYTFELDRRWAFSSGFALAVYEDGDGKDLGGPVQFRSSFEISRRARGRSRFGLVFNHLSNGGLYDLNPGSNSVLFTLALARGQRGHLVAPGPG